MSNTTQLIKKVRLEKLNGLLLMSVYKQHFLTEVDLENEIIVIPANADDPNEPVYHLN